MIGTFNYDAWKSAMQNMFDFGKSFDFSKMSSEHMDKIWHTHAHLINFMCELNRALNDNMANLAERYSSIARRNVESMVDFSKESTQSPPTPQRVMEKFQENMQKNVQDAKELAEIYVKANMQLLEMYQNQFKAMAGKCCCSEQKSESCYSAKKK